jgi:hypothetical protein
MKPIKHKMTTPRTARIGIPSFSIENPEEELESAAALLLLLSGPPTTRVVFVAEPVVVATVVVGGFGATVKGGKLVDADGDVVLAEDCVVVCVTIVGDDEEGAGVVVSQTEVVVDEAIPVFVTVDVVVDKVVEEYPVPVIVGLLEVVVVAVEEYPVPVVN